MNTLTRRGWIQAAGASAGLFTIAPAEQLFGQGSARKGKPDSLPMQLYQSLTESQKQKICLAVDDPKR